MIGVIIITYNSGDVITSCLESLAASEKADLSIVICDNASQDDTVEKVRDWARARAISFEEFAGPSNAVPRFQVSLLCEPVNRGFAAGVNCGLRFMMRDRRYNLFWILNPDCEVTPNAAAAFECCAKAKGDFALMGSRIIYLEPPGLIQSDGGRVGRWTGLCRNVNQGADPSITRRPAAEELDFISGASVVASRRFVETAGLMPEDYFLYYEEVEWAARRGKLPLVLCDGAVIHHHGGTAIGTGAVNRLPTPFALYFNYRNRMQFIRRQRPLAFPIAYLASLARVTKLFARGARAEAGSALRGMHGCPPPRAVRDRLSPEAAALAFDQRVTS